MGTAGRLAGWQAGRGGREGGREGNYLNYLTALLTRGGFFFGVFCFCF